jgi:hypothetical protein
MTLENCERLLAHFEKVGNSAAAKDMREHLKSRQKSAPSKEVSPDHVDVDALLAE